MAYLSHDTYKARVANLSSIGFGSVASWAADLYSDFGKGGTGDPWNENVDRRGLDCEITGDPCAYSGIDDFNAKTANLIGRCRQAAFLPYLSCLLDNAYKEFGDQNKDFDSKVGDSADWFHRVSEAQMDHAMFGTTDGTIGPAMKCTPPQRPQVFLDQKGN